MMMEPGRLHNGLKKICIVVLRRRSWSQAALVFELFDCFDHNPIWQPLIFAYSVFYRKGYRTIKPSYFRVILHPGKEGTRTWLTQGKPVPGSDQTHI